MLTGKIYNVKCVLKSFIHLQMRVFSRTDQCSSDNARLGQDFVFGFASTLVYFTCFASLIFTILPGFAVSLHTYDY